MATKIIFIALLSSVNIKNVYSYATYGFYQGPNKVNKISQPTKNPSHQHSNINKQYVGNGFYQGPGPNKIELPPPVAQNIPMPQYTGNGFYQGPGPNKIELPPPVAQNIPMPQYQQTEDNVKYMGHYYSGYYQGPEPNKIEPIPLPKQNQEKYITSGFYQGLKKVDPVPLKQTETTSGFYKEFTGNGFYQGPDPDSKNTIEHNGYSSGLYDNEKYILKQIENLFEDDARIKLLMKLIKKINLL